jgi:ketosteroid isomerase-like protein
VESIGRVSIDRFVLVLYPPKERVSKGATVTILSASLSDLSSLSQPDVVLVSAHLQVEGQKTIGGGGIGVRDNFSLRVLFREPGGEWRIVSEMYNDANQERTYEAH